MLFERGLGVPQDFTEAAKWYRKAAQRGRVEAQLQLGHMYEQGAGLPRDYVLGHMWFSLAAAHGDDAAAKALNELASKMTPDQIAEAQRMAREWKPK